MRTVTYVGRADVMIATAAGGYTRTIVLRRGASVDVPNADAERLAAAYPGRIRVAASTTTPPPAAAPPDDPAPAGEPDTDTDPEEGN